VTREHLIVTETSYIIFVVWADIHLFITCEYTWYLHYNTATVQNNIPVVQFLHALRSITQIFRFLQISQT